MNLIIHPRVCTRHPHLSEDDIKHAWQNSFYEAIRPDSPNFPEYLWIGRDAKGRDIEMVGTLTTQGVLIYHANTPLSARTKKELDSNSQTRKSIKRNHNRKNKGW